MIVQCDFDGTVIQNNMSYVIREHYAHESWRKIEEDYFKGLYTVEQSNRLQYPLVKASREALVELVKRNIKTRPGFGEFVQHCRDNNIGLVIVSSGIDFYIETILEELGMGDIELYCGRSTFTGEGIKVIYKDPQGREIDRGFKESYLAWLRERGGEVAYIGDGLSDVEAALLADHAFATGYLVRLLGERSAACTPFSDFYDIKECLGSLTKSA